MSLENQEGNGEEPKVMSLYMPGGGMKGIISLSVLSRIEELTEKPITDLFQIMEGGSVSTFLIAGMNVRKSSDPESPDYNKPKISTKEGLKLFVEKTPGVFPVEPDRINNMLLDQAGDVVEGKIIESALADLQNAKNEGWLAKQFSQAGACLKLAAALGVDKITDAAPEDYMYSGEDLASLFQEVLGENTRLSDVLNTVHFPCYNALNGTVEFLTCRKENLLDPTSGNAEVTHNDPKLWEVCMAATANTFAYKPYILGDAMYTDGAGLHKPLTQAIRMQKHLGETEEIRLVSLDLKPQPNARIEAEIGYDPNNLEQLRDNFAEAGAIGGAAKGRIAHLANYGESLEDQAMVELLGEGNYIEISPSQENFDTHKGVLGELKSLDASPETIKGLLEFSGSILRENDVQIRILALDLAENLLLRGEITLEELQEIEKNIEDTPIEKSTIPNYLRELAGEETLPVVANDLSGMGRN